MARASEGRYQKHGRGRRPHDSIARHFLRAPPGGRAPPGRVGARPAVPRPVVSVPGPRCPARRSCRGAPPVGCRSRCPARVPRPTVVFPDLPSVPRGPGHALSRPRPKVVSPPQHDPRGVSTFEACLRLACALDGPERYEPLARFFETYCDRLHQMRRGRPSHGPRRPRWRNRPGFSGGSFNGQGTPGEAMFGTAKKKPGCRSSGGCVRSARRSARGEGARVRRGRDRVLSPARAPVGPNSAPGKEGRPGARERIERIERAIFAPIRANRITRAATGRRHGVAADTGGRRLLHRWP